MAAITWSSKWTRYSPSGKSVGASITVQSEYVYSCDPGFRFGSRGIFRARTSHVAVRLIPFTCPCRKTIGPVVRLARFCTSPLPVGCEVPDNWLPSHAVAPKANGPESSLILGPSPLPFWGKEPIYSLHLNRTANQPKNVAIFISRNTHPKCSKSCAC